MNTTRASTPKPTSSMAVAKLLQLIMDIEHVFLTSHDSTIHQQLRSSADFFKDFLGGEQVFLLAYRASDDRYEDVLDPTASSTSISSWISLLATLEQTHSLHQWNDEPADRERQIVARPIHQLLSIPLDSSYIGKGWLIVTEPHHPHLKRPSFRKQLELVGLVFHHAIVRRPQQPIATMMDESTINRRIAEFSHQLRTPLMGVLNALNLLQSTGTTPSGREYVDIAQVSAQTMKDTLDRILSIAKLENHQKASFDTVFDLESELLELLQSHALLAQQKKLKLYFDMPEALNQKVRCDSVLLRHVVLNLLSNAVKYTAQGSVTLRVLLGKKTREQVTVTLEVADTGIGIPEHYLKQLTKPFFRVNELMSQAQQGTGLGLAIVKDTLVQLGSSLRIDTRVDQGSRFSFDLDLDIVDDTEMYHFESFTHQRALLVYGAHTDKQYVEQRLRHLQLPYDDLEFGETSKYPAVYQQTYQYIFLLGNLDEVNQWIKEHPKRFKSTPVLLSVCHCSLEPQCQSFAISQTLCLMHSRLRWKQQLLALSNPVAILRAEPPPLVGHVLDPWRVLIVDDNPINLKTLQSLLTLVGLEVEIASDSITGLRKVAADPYDFILLDIKMPELTGPEVLQRIRLMKSPNATIPIFAATAYAFEEEREEFLSLGFNEVITKPIDLNHLLHVMIQHKTGTLDQLPDAWAVPPRPTFDLDEFNHHYEGMDALKAEVLQLFIDQSEGSLARIQHAVATLNYDKIAFEAHYYKGSCSYLSAPRITWLCAKMIEYAKRKEAEPLPQLMAQLIAETTLFNYNVRDYLQQQDPALSPLRHPA